MFELIGINRGMIQEVGHNLSPKIKQVGYADESHIKLRGERDVIGLRNPTEYKRAFRRMLTSADLHKVIKVPSVITFGPSSACLTLLIISATFWSSYIEILT